METYYHYYVEGENEKALIEALKVLDFNGVKRGKVEVFNPLQERITRTRIRLLKKYTTVVLLFDTDVPCTETLKSNITMLQQSNNVRDVICVMQVDNIEDELIRSTDIKSITELLKSDSKTEFKRDFNRERNLYSKLHSHNFDINKIWTSVPPISYAEIENRSDLIKTLKKHK